MVDNLNPPDATSRMVLLVGLDAADHTLLLNGMDDGSLPHPAKIRADGAWGVVSSPHGFGSGAEWPSIATAVFPRQAMASTTTSRSAQSRTRRAVSRSRTSRPFRSGSS